MVRPNKLLALFSTLIICPCLSVSGATPKDAPPTVDQVDLQHYTGLWYELARLPVFFQKANELATAHYELQPDGTLGIVNTAIKTDGSSRAVTGTAVPVTGSKNTKLKVTIDNFFAKLFGSPPAYGNYWILDLEPDYSIALVGSPKRKTLWLLARTPEISQAKLNSYIAHAEALGFDTSKLIINNGKFQ
jgi:apolipoprotein D and lipocalin family protein